MARDNRAYMKAYYQANKAALIDASKLYQRHYRKTKPGFLTKLYANMVSRVTGKHGKHHIYLGLPIIPGPEFRAWASSDPAFNQLHDEWAASGYDRRRVPSIDRIDSDGGYTIGNMRFITLSENSRLGNWTQRYGFAD